MPTKEETNWLIEHLIGLSKGSPRTARGVRDLIKKALSEHDEGTDAHDQLLATLQSLDLYIAEQGKGYG